MGILPVDSEHSALFQLIEAAGAEAVESVVITGSGGPFRGRNRAELEAVTTEQALAHPTWSMGRKDQHRFGHAHEQGPGGHRGPPSVRAPLRAHQTW